MRKRVQLAGSLGPCVQKTSAVPLIFALTNGWRVSPSAPEMTTEVAELISNNKLLWFEGTANSKYEIHHSEKLHGWNEV